MGGSLKLTWRTTMSLSYPSDMVCFGLETFCYLPRQRGVSATVTLTLGEYGKADEESGKASHGNVAQQP